MKIHAGDYVTLKSIKEVKHFYKSWNVVDNGCVKADENYFSTEMLSAMNTSNMYSVIATGINYVWVDIKGKMWSFNEKCIKDVYRLTKVN